MKIGILAGGTTDESPATLLSAEQTRRGRGPRSATTPNSSPSAGATRSDDLAWITRVRACDIAFPLVAGLEGAAAGTARALCRLRFDGSGPGRRQGRVQRPAAGLGLRQDALTCGLSPWDAPEAVERAGLRYPLFVKPARLGASVGISRVDSPAGLAAAIAIARSHDHHVLVETAVVGREVEVAAIVGDEVEVSRAGVLALPAGQAWQTIEAKQRHARLVTDHDLSARTVERLCQLTAELARRADLSGGIRIDYFVTPEDEVLVSEINCVPGHGPASNFPYLFEQSGVDRPRQLEALLRAAQWNFARASAARVRL